MVDPELALDATSETEADLEPQPEAAGGDAVLDDLLVEEVSIDGMCGVY